MNPNVAGYGIQRPATVHQQPMLPPAPTSARRSSVSSKRPQLIQRKLSRDYDSYSSSCSDSSESEDERHGTRRYHNSRDYERRSARSRSRRRPELSKSYTTDGIVRRPSQRDERRIERIPRDPRYEEYLSSDQYNSDLTERAAVGRRPSTRSARRPSDTTTLSNKSTLPSSLSGHDVVQIEIEDRHGRLRETRYVTRDEFDRLKERINSRATADDAVRLARQMDMKTVREARRQQDDVEKYQAERTGMKHDLTAENVKRTLKRTSGSHISGSLRSQHSAGSKGSRSDGIIIRSGDTVLKVSGDQEVEIKPGEDGGPAQVIFTSSSTVIGARDSGYQGSKSSSSGHGRSRVGAVVMRERERELEYDDYPRGY